MALTFQLHIRRCRSCRCSSPDHRARTCTGSSLMDSKRPPRPTPPGRGSRTSLSHSNSTSAPHSPAQPSPCSRSQISCAGRSDDGYRLIEFRPCTATARGPAHRFAGRIPKTQLALDHGGDGELRHRHLCEYLLDTNVASYVVTATDRVSAVLRPDDRT